jgi:hypothetical protein
MTATDSAARRPSACTSICEPPRFHITWREGRTVVASSDVSIDTVTEAGGDKHYPGLASFLAREWQANGTHRDPGDPALDEAVLHVRNSAADEDVIAALDAVRAPHRVVPGAKIGPVFKLSFATDSAGLRAAKRRVHILAGRC